MARRPRRHSITQDNNANPHEHTVVEILVCPGDSPLRRNAEVCTCGAERLVDLEGKPAGVWSVWKPVPYMNAIGHIDQITQGGFAFTIANPEDSGSLTVGTQVTMLHHSRETGTLIKVQGTITAVDQARARFALTQADQEDLLLREGTPVYLESSEDLT